MDAVTAVAAAGVERETLREALAATLVKDEAERPTFDRLFDVAFPLGRATAPPGRRRREGVHGGGAGGRGGAAAGAGVGRHADDEPEAPGTRPGSRDDARGAGERPGD